MRDLRDYPIRSKDGVSLNPGSPFNIKRDSATLNLFTREDIRELVVQHVQETGQEFSAEALDAVWEFTRGQPWLVNALLQKCTWKSGGTAARPVFKSEKQHGGVEGRAATIPGVPPGWW